MVKNNIQILNKIVQEVKISIQDKRRVMYSDIINLLVRQGIKDDFSKKLIIWCNYKIRIGEIYVEI
ncbi:MAG: hypothetical protein EU539_01565 [Promethearchaeota archaeon]|nr:MAG: hypothetical protein EU539_01565 [Candidatus Lokiarchaeota archaeon]